MKKVIFAFSVFAASCSGNSNSTPDVTDTGAVVIDTSSVTVDTTSSAGQDSIVVNKEEGGAAGVTSQVPVKK
jgi:hypothetical protein